MLDPAFDLPAWHGGVAEARLVREPTGHGVAIASLEFYDRWRADRYFVRKTKERPAWSPRLALARRGAAGLGLSVPPRQGPRRRLPRPHNADLSPVMAQAEVRLAEPLGEIKPP